VKNKLIITLFFYVFYTFGLSPVNQQLAFHQNDVIIFCFHDINGSGKYSITSEEFDQILELLSKNFEVYSLKSWYEKALSKKTFKKTPVVLTFDDGYPSIINEVIPKINSRKFGATLFIYLDRYFDQSTIFKQLATVDGDIEIGSHSMTHSDMKTIYKKNPVDFYKEVYLSRKKLEYLINKPVQSWAWPYGSYTENMVKLAKDAGYTIQVNTDDKIATLNNDGSQLFLNRYTIQNPNPVEQVISILNKGQKK